MPETISPKFDAFIAPARAYPQLWRLLCGLLFGAVIYYGLTLTFFFYAQISGIRVFRALAGQGTPLETAVLLASFVTMAIAVAIVAKMFQKRGVLTLIGRDLQDVRTHFIVTATIVFAILVVWSGFSMLFYAPEPNLPFTTWLAWLPVSLVLIFVQTTSEELVFRGYIQQQLAVRFRSRWVWMFLPSALFGLGHYDVESFGPNAWLVVANITIFGLVAADLTARTGNLGAAMGLHFVNNMMVFLFIALKGDISGLSLNVTPFSVADVDIIRASLIGDLILVPVIYVICIRTLARRSLL